MNLNSMVAQCKLVGLRLGLGLGLGLGLYEQINFLSLQGVFTYALTGPQL